MYSHKSRHKNEERIAQTILNQDPSLLTDTEKRERNIKIRTALKTIHVCHKI